jgi:hypothetical protein
VGFCRSFETRPNLKFQLSLFCFQQSRQVDDVSKTPVDLNAGWHVKRGGVEGLMMISDLLRNGHSCENQNVVTVLTASSYRGKRSCAACIPS